MTQQSLESISKTNSLETPSREDDVPIAGTSAAGMTELESDSHSISNNTNNKEEEESQQQTDTNEPMEESAEESPQPIITKHSSFRSMDNPLTLARKKKIEEGSPLIVKFDERVVVHTVPYWDPCGETFYDDADDDDQGPRG